MMKTCNLAKTFATLAVTALVIQIPLSVQAQDGWNTVNDFLSDGLSANSGDIGTDENGVIYSVGSATIDGGNRNAIVRGSTDSGTNWTTLDSYAESGWNTAHFRAFASGGGSLFAGGELATSKGAAGYRAWVIRESSDSGTSWQLADDLLPSDVSYDSYPSYASCGDIKVSPTGDVYAAGFRADTTADLVITNSSWLVRKRAAKETEFVTVDTVSNSAGAPIEARAIGFDPNNPNVVFVVGYLPERRHHLPVWTVRRSSDGGITWTTVDSFADHTWFWARAEDIVVDSSGAIFVCGYGDNSNTGVVTWIVRRSTDAGASWSVVDSFSYGTSARAQGITLDADGNPIVCGYAQDQDGRYRWLVRRSTVGQPTWVKQRKTKVLVTPISWTTSDDYLPDTVQYAYALDICCDKDGNVFVTGNEGGDVCHLITRMLPASSN